MNEGRNVTKLKFKSKIKFWLLDEPTINLDDEGKKIGLKDGFRAVYCLFKYKFF